MLTTSHNNECLSSASALEQPATQRVNYTSNHPVQQLESSGLRGLICQSSLFN